jgi:hypothetical protein
MSPEKIPSGVRRQKPVQRGWECFVSSGCVNPTPTIPALTMVASDYLIEQYKRGES